MKKFTALFVLLALIINMFAVSVFASDVTIDEEKVKFFAALGVYDIESVPNADIKITRGDFVKYLLKLIDRENSVKPEEQMFWDVTSENPYYASAQMAKALGIINGNSDGSFEPYSYIEPVEATVIMINALGYGPLVKLKGNYPTSVSVIANDLRISSALKSSDSYLNFAEMIELFYEATDCLVCDTSSIREDILTFDKSDECFLEYYRDIKKLEGIAEYRDITASENGMRSIILNGSNVINVSAYFDGYIGANVELFAKEIGPNLDFVYMFKSTANKIVTITFEDNNPVPTASGIDYQTDTKDKKIDFGSHTKFFYNNVPLNFVTHSVSDMFTKSHGKVEAIDNDSNGVFDYVHVYGYDFVAVKAFDNDTKNIYDYNSNLNTVKLKDYEVYEIYDAGGKLLTSVSPLNVLTVTKSLDNEYVKVVVSEKTIEGKIEAVNEDNSIVINGVEYITVNEFQTGVDSSILIKAGKEGTFLLDENNRVVYITTKSDNIYKSAILASVKYDGRKNSTIELKIFDASDEYKFLPLADRVKIDGKNYTENDKIATALGYSASSFNPTAIAYQTNEEGQITYIDTPTKGVSEADNTLTRRSQGTSFSNEYFYKGSSNANYRKVFGGKYIAGNDDLVVLVDGSYDSNDDIIVSTIDWDDLKVATSIGDDSSYQAEIFSFSEDSPFANIAIVAAPAVTGVSEDVYLYVDRTTVADEKEKYNHLTKITCYKGSAQTNLYLPSDYDNLLTGENMIPDNANPNVGTAANGYFLTSSDIAKVANLKPGDLFRAGVDSKGYVVAIEKLYDYENKLFINPTAKPADSAEARLAITPNETSTFMYNSSNRLLVGTVYMAENGYARYYLTNTLDTTSNATIEAALESIYAVGSMYTVDERGNVTVTKVDASTPILGKKYGEDIKIFVQAEYTRPMSVYYIK